MRLHRSSARTRLFFPVLLSFLFLAGAAFAASANIDELYRKSGLREQLLYIAPSMIDDFDKSVKETAASERAPDQLIEAVRDLMAKSYSVDSLKDIVLGEYEANLAPDEIRTVIAWLDSPTGQKSTQLDIESSKPELEREIQAFIAEVDKNPPPEARMKLALDYERTTSLTEATASMIIGMQLATAVAYNALFVPPEQQKPLSELSEAAEKNRTMLEGTLRPELLSRILCTYRSLSDQELQQLIDFEASAPGKKFTRTSLAGIQKAMVGATGKFSNSVFQKMKEFQEKEKPKS